MNLTQWKREIGRWHVATFGPDYPRKATLKHIRREIRELEAETDEGKRLEEIADIAILTLGLAHRESMSLMRLPTVRTPSIANLRRDFHNLVFAATQDRACPGVYDVNAGPLLSRALSRLSMMAGGWLALEMAVAVKMTENRARAWGTPDAHGVVEHKR